MARGKEIRLATVLSVLLAFAGNAQAATVSASAPVAGTNFAFDVTEQGLYSPEVRTITFARTLAGFDTSLGTLDAVELSFLVNFRSIGTLDGGASFFSQAGFGETRLTATARLFGTNLRSATLTQTYRCDDASNFVTDCPVTAARSRSLSGSLVYSPTEWAALTSSGARNPTFYLDFRAEAHLNEGDEMRLDGEVLSGSFFRLNYLHTPPDVTPGPASVPLPAGLPLLLAGLGGFALLRQRATQAWYRR